MPDLTTAQRLAAYRDELTAADFPAAVAIGLVRIAARSNGTGLVLATDQPEVRSILGCARDVVARLEELVQWDDLLKQVQSNDGRTNA